MLMRRATGIRPLPQRGMGQSVNYLNPFSANCNWWDVACWTGLDTLISGQLPQNPNATGPQANLPAIPAPTVPQQAPTTPPGYNPQTGTITTPPGTPPGQLAIPPMNQPYVPSYPNNPGGGGGGGGTSSCDWTQATWTDITTWCSANWLIAGMVALGGLLFVKMAVKR
jgi:hypothetical protein